MNDSQKQGFKRHWYTKVMDWYRWSPVYFPMLNEAARAGLRLKFKKDESCVRQICRGRETEIEEWFESLDLFFGFSSTRGGTVFLSNLLKNEVPKSHIEHEANVVDYWVLPKARLDENDSLDYVRNFRRQEIFCRARHEIEVYGEINPFIRRHCAAFKTVFPKARFFHMVRDPRDVVRSTMAREVLGKKDPMKNLISPPPWDPYCEQWSKMDRFERVCWEWQDDNKYMREQIPQLIKFEDMMSDYESFNKKLLGFLDIEVSEYTWSRYVNRPRNVSRKHSFSHWTQWDKKQLASFNRICGDEMAKYGYEI